MATLRVVEIVGPTFSGEGRSIGRPCFFVRLADCNLHCTWCDTAYAWDWKGLNGVTYNREVESRDMEDTSIATILEEMYAKWSEPRSGFGMPKTLVISGGEPMVQQVRLAEFVRLIQHKGWWVEIETAGTIKDSVGVKPNGWNISPKLASSGNVVKARYHPDVLRWFSHQNQMAADEGHQPRKFAPNVCFKFVVTSMHASDDLAEVDWITGDCEIHPRMIWIMAEGKTSDEQREAARMIAPFVLMKGWRMSPRLQVDLWGNERGR